MCSSRLCPALKQRPVREPASTHVRSFTWEIPRSTHFCVLTQNYYPSAHISVPVASQLSAAKITCRYLQPASTHAFMFIMHVSYPPAHTFVCPKPVSAHRALDCFVYTPSAHILSGSYPLNLQPRISTQRAEPSRQHTYPAGWLRNGSPSHIVVVLVW